jgi:hypothetical protein
MVLCIPPTQTRAKLLSESNLAQRNANFMPLARNIFSLPGHCQVQKPADFRLVVFAKSPNRFFVNCVPLWAAREQDLLHAGQVIFVVAMAQHRCENTDGTCTLIGDTPAPRIDRGGLLF